MDRQKEKLEQEPLKVEPLWLLIWHITTNILYTKSLCHFISIENICMNSYSCKVSVYSKGKFCLQVAATSQVLEPRAGDVDWHGREVIAALCHSPGHWRAYVKVQGVWWHMDRVAGTIIQANPFHA